MLLDAVKELRAKCELDEEKWKRFKQKFFAFFLVAVTIILIKFTYEWNKNGIVIGAAVLIVCVISLKIFVWDLYLRFKINNLMLYTAGNKTNAEVLFGKIKEEYRGLNTYYFEYLYSDIIGREYIGNNKRCNNPYHKYLKIQEMATSQEETKSPDKGDKIEILYFENNPEISIPFLDSFNKKYNLRIKQ